MITADIVIVGTGIGGGTLAWGLRNTGARILLIERGDFLPQEAQNWVPEAVFGDNRYKPDEIWESADGRSFKPGFTIVWEATQRFTVPPCPDSGKRILGPSSTRGE